MIISIRIHICIGVNFRHFYERTKTTTLYIWNRTKLILNSNIYIAHGNMINASCMMIYILMLNCVSKTIKGQRQNEILSNCVFYVWLLFQVKRRSYFQSHDNIEEPGSRVKRVTDWLTNPEIRLFISGFHPNSVERVQHTFPGIHWTISKILCLLCSYLPTKIVPSPDVFWPFWEGFFFINSLNWNKRHLVTMYNKNYQQTRIIWILLFVVSIESCRLTCLILTAKSV